MTRTDFAEVAIADVLAEAGVSTRAFYRHFASGPCGTAPPPAYCTRLILKRTR